MTVSEGLFKILEGKEVKALLTKPIPYFIDKEG